MKASPLQRSSSGTCSRRRSMRCAFAKRPTHEELRPQIARVRGVTPNEVMIDELGDLRILRKSIVHDGGHLSLAEHAKLKVMSNLCKPDAPVRFTHDEMHKLFVHIKQGIGRLILEYTGG